MPEHNVRTDILHLLQAKSMAKKVPDNLHSIRRIIEYTKYTKDSGFEDSIQTPTPGYVNAIYTAVALLYVSFILSWILAWWWEEQTEYAPVRVEERDKLLADRKARINTTVKSDEARKDIVKEIRQKLELE